MTAATIPLAQTTLPGTLIVTVARDGARMANRGRFSYPIFCTALYRAEQRADGVITWRRAGQLRDGTAGHGVTAPMTARALRHAQERGLEFVAGVRYGRICD